MKKLQLFLGSLLFASTLFAQSCWDLNDEVDMAHSELDSNIKFSFRDAVDCSKIDNLKVTFFGQIFHTNENGEISFPLPPSELDITDILVAKKKGYITLEQNVSASVGTFLNKKFLVTKDIPLDQARVILSWSDKPSDLDLHIRSEDFHISYRNKEGAQYKVSLDRDSLNGFGPETITIKKLDKEKKYKVYVSKYSHDGDIDSSVNLSFYANGKLDKSVNLSRELSSSCIQVATIYKNKINYNIKDISSSKCK